MRRHEWAGDRLYGSRGLRRGAGGDDRPNGATTAARRDYASTDGLHEAIIDPDRWEAVQGRLMAEEVSRKLGSTVTMDVTRPLQAFDAGGRARAAKQIVDTLAAAKEAGVDPSTALRLVDWAE